MSKKPFISSRGKILLKLAQQKNRNAASDPCGDNNVCSKVIPDDKSVAVSAAAGNGADGSTELKANDKSARVYDSYADGDSNRSSERISSDKSADGDIDRNTELLLTKGGTESLPIDESGNNECPEIDISLLEELINPQNDPRSPERIVEIATTDIDAILKSSSKGRHSSTDECMDQDDEVRDPDWQPPADASTSDDEVFVGDVDVEVQTIVAQQEEIVDKTDRKRAKAGKADRSQWAKVKNKNRRMHGQKYESCRSEGGAYNRINRSERTLKPRGCSKTCSQRKCCTTFDEVDRNEIFDLFWDADWSAKKMFVSSMIDKLPVKERKVQPKENNRRDVSLVYHLKKNDIRLKVCKQMFLNTLGVGEKMVYGWIEQVERPEATTDADLEPQAPQNNNSNTSSERNSERSSKVSKKPKKVSKKVMDARLFLESLPNLPSHYCRSTTNKRYLEPVFADMAELYQTYKTRFDDEESVCKRTFLDIFQDLNLSLYKPKKDQCDICCGFQTRNIPEDIYTAHILRKDAARKEKSDDKLRAASDPTLAVLTLDLQAVLLSPLLKASSMYYKTKLSCHNYTVFDLTSKDCVCYFWHEGEGELSANSFASCLDHYIRERLEQSPDIKEIIIYSDGCTYQNRNVTLSNMLLKVSYDLKITITQKILEKGHTQMECDSVHSLVERNIKKRPIYIPQNYIDIIKSCRSAVPYQVHYLSHSFFKDFSSLRYYSSIRPGRAIKGDPVVTDLRVLKYCPEGAINYKLFYEQDFQPLPRSSRSGNPSEDDVTPKLYRAPIPIKATKYQHLQELKLVIPRDYHPFYDNLIHN